MGVNTQVFASNPERENFYKLSRQWGQSHRLYHNLPFLSVFNTKNLIDVTKLYSWDWLQATGAKGFNFHVGDIDYSRLKKTSIDYTLCDDSEKPLVCIDFDGLKDGFNVGVEYHSDGPPDPWRQTIMSLKLKVAHGSMFPYFVVGYDHFKDVCQDIQLTMVDGIIGEVLANSATAERVANGFQPEDAGYTQPEFDSLDPDAQHEIVQDWLWGVEIEADLTCNPVSKKLAELTASIPHLIRSTTYLTYPDADRAKTLAERRKMLDATISIGCRCTLHSSIEIRGGKMSTGNPECGEITATVWLPNFKTPMCGTMLTLVETLAQLIAYDEARRRARK